MNQKASINTNLVDIIHCILWICVMVEHFNMYHRIYTGISGNMIKF